MADLLNSSLERQVKCFSFMFLNSFYSTDGNSLLISGLQGSRFAKLICDDFNPIHNHDEKSFCVPGDLLFSIVLQRYGLSEHMTFRFTEMLPSNLPLYLPEDTGKAFQIIDSNKTCYLEVERQGGRTVRENCIESLIRCYVRFSGHNFPHILMPLMQENNVMINPRRPFVIYESMSLSMKNLDFNDLDVHLVDASLNTKGKRGEVLLSFQFLGDHQVSGTGTKKLIVAGLREYEQVAVDQMIATYNSYKRSFSGC